MLGEWFAQSFVLACQSFNLVRLAILGRLSSVIVIASASRSHATVMADSRKSTSTEFWIRKTGAARAGTLNCYCAVDLRAFGSREPLERQVWRLHVGAPGVRAICAFPEQRLGFDRMAFATDPRIASLRWGAIGNKPCATAHARSAI